MTLLKWEKLTFTLRSNTISKVRIINPIISENQVKMHILECFHYYNYET